MRWGLVYSRVGVSKKTRKPIKPRKPKKKNRLKFWKNRPVRFGFGFINKKSKKRTEPNRNRQKTGKKIEPNRKKPSQNRVKTGKTEPNRFEPVFSLKKLNQTETGRFDPVSVRFRFFFQKKKFQFGYFFLLKPNRTENNHPYPRVSQVCLQARMILVITPTSMLLLILILDELGSCFRFVYEHFSASCLFMNWSDYQIYKSIHKLKWLLNIVKF